MKMRHTLVLAVSLAIGGAALPTAPAETGFSSCVAGLKRSAARAGVSSAIIAKAFKDIEPDEKVLRLSRRQPEFKTPIWDYLTFLVDDRRIRDGKAKMAEHEDILRAAEKRFGVSRFVIAAVWGVESDYGQAPGDSFIPQALATLYCKGGRRKRFWHGELIAALKLVQRGDLKLEKLYGSWAGAFGQTQFMPTTYRRLAVDFDGDGRRDLVDSVADALGSTGNFLKRAGWKSGESWMIEVKVPANYRGPRGRKRMASLATWNKRGVRRADGSRLKGSGRAGLLLPAGRNGPGFLVFRNFNVIYKYNQAESYALAISHLADRLAGLPGLRTAWPTDDPGLTRDQRTELQRRLLAAGYDIGEADGKIGEITRGAIKEAERKHGMKPTGRAGRRIFDALAPN